MKKMEKWMLEMFTKMKEYGITQSKIAKQIGVSRETVNKALNGENSMSDAENRIKTAIEEIIKGSD